MGVSVGEPAQDLGAQRGERAVAAVGEGVAEVGVVAVVGWVGGVGGVEAVGVPVVAVVVVVCVGAFVWGGGGRRRQGIGPNRGHG